MLRQSRLFAAAVYLVIGVFGIAQLSARPSLAAIATSAELERGAEGSTARARVEAFLARGQVRVQMRALGVDPDEARARVASLTDAEVARIDSRLQELPAGGSFLGFVVGAILLIMLIVLITDLLGYTDVFTFIHPLPRGNAR